MSPFPFFSGVRVDRSVFFSILYFIIDCLPIFFLDICTVWNNIHQLGFDTFQTAYSVFFKYDM